MRTEGKYKLEGHKVVPCYDLIQWATWFETADRFVGENVSNGIRVSTIFLGLDFCINTPENHHPLVFETEIFGGPHDGYQQRYTTWEEAEAGHQTACELANVSLDSLPFVYEN